MTKFMDVTIGKHNVKTKIYAGESAEDAFERILARKYGRTAVAYPVHDKFRWTIGDNDFYGYVKIKSAQHGPVLDNNIWVEVLPE